MNINRLKFQCVSDIHIDMSKDVSATNTRDIITKMSDILIIIGDVGKLEYYDNYKHIMTLFCNDFKDVYLIPGNHEYYSDNIPFETLKTYLQRLERDIPNLKVLDDSYVDLPGNYRIYGTTLWSRVTSKDAASKQLNIKSSKEEFIGNKYWMNKMFFNSLYNLNNVIYNTKEYGKTLIIASHYAPKFKECLDTKFYNCPYRYWYANSLGYLMKKDNVHTWLYGHTHVNNDIITLNDTRLVSNQYKGKGYSHTDTIVV